ncbi:hypothetical protein [Marisediminicola senii]|uniref:hypothetical protein n=1 Tax=Marisediminicola senii TaxID=2711233 RepID=UPI0013EDEE23|nr:hypothetical protein [Marisediminicola senii]
MRPGTALKWHIREITTNLTYTTEDDLQAALHERLYSPTGNPAVTREVVLSDLRSRIDLMHTSTYPGTTIPWQIGIEVKTKGSLAAVIRQLDRYANCPEIDELILVTTKALHSRVPEILGARRISVHVVSLIKNGL